MGQDANYPTSNVIYLTHNAYYLTRKVIYLTHNAFYLTRKVIYLTHNAYNLKREVIYLTYNAYYLTRKVIYLTHNATKNLTSSNLTHQGTEIFNFLFFQQSNTLGPPNNGLKYFRFCQVAQVGSTDKQN